MKVRNDIDEFVKTIPPSLTLVAVSKYVDVRVIEELISHHLYNLGERRVNELLEKKKSLDNPNIIWHFIGHLQHNKVKNIVNDITYLHSLDSFQTALLISKYRKGEPLKCFIEVSINNEENKNGLPPSDVEDFVLKTKDLPNIEIIGFMMMSRANSTHEELKEQFKALKILKDNINKKYHLHINELSMGMSDDYQEAIEEGATYIRLGHILYED